MEAQRLRDLDERANGMADEKVAAPKAGSAASSTASSNRANVRDSGSTGGDANAAFAETEDDDHDGLSEHSGDDEPEASAPPPAKAVPAPKPAGMSSRVRSDVCVVIRCRLSLLTRGLCWKYGL